MKLSISDRMTITELLPKESNFLTITIIKDIAKKLEISQKDSIKYGIKSKQEGEQIYTTWKKNFEEEIIFTKPEKELIKEQVEKRNKENKATLAIYEIHLKLNEEDKELKEDLYENK